MFCRLFASIVYKQFAKWHNEKAREGHMNSRFETDQSQRDSDHFDFYSDSYITCTSITLKFNRFFIVSRSLIKADSR